MGSLIGEVQQRPQLEARVGYRECDFVVDRELLRGDHVDMVVDVEHRPDLIPAEVLVALAPGFFVGEPPLVIARSTTDTGAPAGPSDSMCTRGLRTWC